MKWVIRGDGTPREVDVQQRGEVFDVLIDGIYSFISSDNSTCILQRI